MSDTQKVVDFVIAALTPHRDTQVPFVFVHTATAFRSCKFAHIRKTQFADEVNDALTDTNLDRSFGTWVFAEFGDGFSLFVRVLNVEDARNLPGAAAVIEKLSQKEAGVGLAFGADAIFHKEVLDQESPSADGDVQGEDYK